MNSPLMEWLNRPNAGMAQPQQAAPEQPQQQPNGMLLANMLRDKFGLGNSEHPLSQFASPFLDMLGTMNFGGKGRTPEGRAEIKARVEAARANNAGKPPSERTLATREKLGQMFSGFRNGMQP